MLEKPDLSDEKMVACLRENYGVAAASVEFLPLGYDAKAGVYRVEADGGTAYFLKAKKGGVDTISLAVPRALKDAGIAQVVAPIPARDGRLTAEIDPFTLILYSFVDGRMVMEAGMADDGWRALGAVVRKMHATQLPNPLTRQMQRETFTPRTSGLVRELAAIIDAREFDDPFRREMAAIWREQRGVIRTITDHAESLGRKLQRRGLPLVLCHADLHTANILVDAAGAFHIVDWDGAVLAPKERDLMFVTGAGAGGYVAFGSRAQELFFQGYGDAEIDAMALAYYRCDWVIQDLGEFGKQVLLDDGVGDETRADVLRNVRGMFQPGETAEIALRSG